MKVKLGEIADFINGGAWNQREYCRDGVPVVKVTNLKNGTVELDDVDYLPESSLDKYQRHTLFKGDLVVATVGSHPNLIASAAGRATIIPAMAEGALLNQNALCIRTKSEVLHQGYLGYLGKSDLFQGYVKSIGRGAANQVRIALGLIKEFTFDLPSLPTQCKIASILSAYDKLIENNLKRIKLLEEKAFFNYKEIVTNEKVELLILEQVTQLVKRGVSPKYVEEDGIVVLNQKCIRNHIVSFEEARLTDSQKKISEERMLQKFDTLINSTGTGTLGRIAMNIQDKFPVTVDSHVTIVRANQLVTPIFLCQSLFAQENVIENMGEGSTNQTELSAKKLSSEIKIAIPSMETMLAYEQEASLIFNLIWNLQKQNEKLSEARDILLPRLMNGEIAV